MVKINLENCGNAVNVQLTKDSFARICVCLCLTRVLMCSFFVITASERSRCSSSDRGSITIRASLTRPIICRSFNHYLRVNVSSMGPFFLSTCLLYVQRASSVVCMPVSALRWPTRAPSEARSALAVD